MKEAFVDSDEAFIIAGCFAWLGVFVSGHNIYHHLKYYNEPDKQLWTIRLLIIIPLYGIVSWICMHFADTAAYFAAIRDCYEAFVIYCFLMLILAYMGGEDICVATISQKVEMQHPIPLCFLPKLKLNNKFLRICKQLCLQFVVQKPIMALLTIIFLSIPKPCDNVEQHEGCNLYESAGYQTVLLVIYNTSYTLALYGLFLFYLAVREYLKGHNPVGKFFAIKSIVFLTYWQYLAISFVPENVIPNKEQKEQWNSFILCFEILMFAVWTHFVFPWKEFSALGPGSVWQNLRTDVLTVSDVIQETKAAFSRPVPSNDPLKRGLINNDVLNSGLGQQMASIQIEDGPNRDFVVETGESPIYSKS